MSDNTYSGNADLQKEIVLSSWSMKPTPRRASSSNPSNTQSTFLYIGSGGFTCESVGLFLKAGAVPKYVSAFPMVIVGGFGSSQFTTVPLFINGSAASHRMNLFISGKDSGGTSKVIRFVVTGSNPTIGKQTTLFVQNDYQAANDDGTTLFIQGTGTTPGAVPSSSGIGLYTERGNGTGITMFLCNKNASQSLSLHVSGAPALTKSAPLSITGFGGNPSLTAPLMVRGGVFQGINQNMTLTIPKVVGFTPSSAQLYINGFNY